MEDARFSTDPTNGLVRSPELMDRTDTALLVVDVQQKLVDLISARARILWNIRRLLKAAEALGLPHAVTEQNPGKLGPTARELSDVIGTPAPKMAFSCAECSEIFDRWRDAGIYRVLVCGIETHVCVQQTAFDLSASGFQVYLAVDAVGARHSIDHETALRRMEAAGVVVTSTESAMFEWCRTSATPEFRTISALVKEMAPD